MVHIYLDLHRFTIEIMEHTWILRDCFSTYPKEFPHFLLTTENKLAQKSNLAVFPCQIMSICHPVTAQRPH